MVQPSGEGAERCIRMALNGVDEPIDYINTHGTSTPVGDVAELSALKTVFGDGSQIPPFNSTKSLTGHSLGAAGVHEAIYTLLMMENNFIAASANVQEVTAEAQDMPIVLERCDDVKISCALSNSFGFGGTNASLTFTAPVV